MKKLSLTILITCLAPFLLAQGATQTEGQGERQSGAPLVVSTSPERADARPLEGAALSGEVYIFLDPARLEGVALGDIEEVAFYLNDAQALSPLQVESVAPFDFAGTREERAYPFNVDDLSRRANVVTAAVTLASGEKETLSASFVAEDVQVKADYYVSTTGSDSADGSVDRPLSTLTKALSLVQPGERIQLREGVYKEYVNSLTFEVASGTQLAPITVESYPGEMAVIDGSERHWSEDESPSYPALFRLEDAEWFVIQNLTFRHAAGRALHLEGDHNVIRNVLSYENHSDGVYVLGDRNLLEGVVSHSNYSEQNGGDSADGIKLVAGNANVIRNCHTYNNSDDGTDIWESTNTLVEFCISHENGRGETGDGQGFKLGSRRTSNNHATVRYNIAYKNRANNFDGNGGGGLTLLHNTSWQAGNLGFRLLTQEGEAGNVATNNISYEDPDINYGDREKLRNNTWNLGIEDPEFISLNPDSPDFLRLAEDSPAVNAGAQVGLPYAGPSPDLGALEHGQEVAEFGFLKDN